jgi:hypothetical protein
MMPLQKFLSVKSFLAVRDMDIKGELWSKSLKTEIESAPLLSLQKGFCKKDTDLKWPTT